MGENCTSRAGVVALAVVCLALGALTASCGGGEEAETPASPTTATPVVTASPSPAPTVTPVPTATPSPTAAPSPDADEPPPDGTTPVPTATPSEAPAAATPSPTATATPSPTPAATPAIEYTELTLGEPRYQPPGYALYSQLRGCFWNCDGGWSGVVRTVLDERSGTLLVENPLAPLEGIGSYFGFRMSESGRRMAAARCVVGYCGGVSEPSDDAEEELWVSDDDGKTWTSWGALPPPSWIVRVTDEDVAVLEWAEVAFMVRWLRSDQVFPEPDDSSGWVSGWDGDTPVWGEPGVQIAPPALTELVGWTWLELQPHPDGSAVWYAKEVGALLLLAVVDAQGAVEDVFGWPSADYVDRLVPMGDGLFVGFRMEEDGGLGVDHMNFVIDLEARSVHPLLGLPDEGPWAEPWRAIPLTTE